MPKILLCSKYSYLHLSSVHTSLPLREEEAVLQGQSIQDLSRGQDVCGIHKKQVRMKPNAYDLVYPWPILICTPPKPISLRIWDCFLALNHNLLDHLSVFQPTASMFFSAFSVASYGAKGRKRIHQKHLMCRSNPKSWPSPFFSNLQEHEVWTCEQPSVMTSWQDEYDGPSPVVQTTILSSCMPGTIRLRATCARDLPEPFFRSLFQAIAWLQPASNWMWHVTSCNSRTISCIFSYIHIFIYLSRLNCTKLGKWLRDWFKSNDLVWLERFCMRICVQPQKKWPCCPYFMGYLSNRIQQIVLSSKYPSLILLTFVRTKFWNRSKREGGT